MSYEQSFRRLRQLAGNPTMKVVKDREEWSSVVPSGYSYDADYDRFVSSSGTVWDETTVSLPYTTVNILPSSGVAALDLAVGGITDTGDRRVRILPADKTTVEAGQWVELDGHKYDLGQITAFPAGAALWYDVELRKR